jgi:hypothetical protein
MPINKTNANADTDLSMSASPLWARKIEAIRNAAKGGASRRLTNSMATRADGSLAAELCEIDRRCSTERHCDAHRLDCA